jgi:hypothetical protein
LNKTDDVLFDFVSTRPTASLKPEMEKLYYWGKNKKLQNK